MTEEAAEPSSSPPNRFYKFLSWLLVAGALVWLAGIMLGNREALAAFASELHPSHLLWIVGSAALAAFCNVTNLMVFRRLLTLNSERSFGLIELSNLYFASQVVRYLPGRFWGIAYQIGKVKEKILPMTILRTNVDQMLLNLGYNAIVSLALLVALGVHPLAGLAGWLLASLCLVFFFSLNLANHLLSLLSERLPKKLSDYCQAARSREPYTASFVLRLLGIKTGSWGVYLVAWMLLFRGIPGIGDISPVLLCSQYTLSWTAGFLAFFTPGGLGIREAAFVLFGAGGLPPATLALLALVLRFWLITIDLMLCAASLIATRIFAAPFTPAQESRLPESRES